MKRMRWLAAVLCFCLLAGTFGCGRSGTTGGNGTAGGNEMGDADFTAGSGEDTIRILSGSENQELEGILKECAKKTGVNLEITYQEEA